MVVFAKGIMELVAEIVGLYLIVLLHIHIYIYIWVYSNIMNMCDNLRYDHIS